MKCLNRRTLTVFGLLLLGLSLVVTVTAQAQARQPGQNYQRPPQQQQQRRLPTNFERPNLPDQNAYRSHELYQLHQSFAGVRRNEYDERAGIRYSDEEWRAPNYNNWDNQRRFLPDRPAPWLVGQHRWLPPEGFRYIGGYYCNGVAVTFGITEPYDGIVVGPNFVPAYWIYQPWSHQWLNPYGRYFTEAPILAATDVVLVEVPQTIVVDDGYGGYITRKVISLETAVYEPTFEAGWGQGAFVFNDYFGVRRGFINVHVRIR
jgi:hypothetical protein